MLNERLMNSISFICLIAMMAVIAWHLADGWMPDKIYAHHPTYTNEYVERLERKAIQYKREAAWYEKSYEGITKILAK